MTDVVTLAGGDPTPSTTLVTCDQLTIVGDGSLGDPLRAVASAIGIGVDEEGTPLPGAPHSALNFIGPGVLTTDAGGGVANVTIPGFEPERTLFVAKSWPAGVDPATHFTSIAAAYVKAATFLGALLPTPANPMAIVVSPGTYDLGVPIVVVSNVHLVGAGQQRAVNIAGAITWNPGVGVNAPQALQEERLNGCFFTIAGTMTINSTGKPLGQFVAPLFRGIIGATAITHIGRALSVPPGADDAFFFFASVVGSTATFTDVGNVNFLSVQKNNIVLNGATALRSAGGFQAGALTLNQTNPCRYTGEAITGAVNVGALSTFNWFTGCVMSGVLTVAAGGAADVRMSNIPAANLAGAGTINRTVLFGAIGPTAIGANPVVIAPLFPDGLYGVNLQLVAGPGNAAATVTPKAGGGFTINDAIGGNTFEFTVTHS